MIRNKIKDKIKAKKPTLGLLSNLSSMHLTEIFGLSGFDFIVFDMEHSTISEETLENLVRTALLAGMVPMARVRKNDSRFIMGALDAGCLGVMVPQVESREEAEHAINSTKYRPEGIRGINWRTIAGKWGFIDPEQYVREINDHVLNMIQIETYKGFENLNDILKVKGIDLIILSPSDLSASMGYPGQPGHDKVVKVLDEIIAITKKAGVLLGGYAVSDKQKMVEFQKNGVLLFLTNPAAFIAETCKRVLKEITESFI